MNGNQNGSARFFDIGVTLEACQVASQKGNIERIRAVQDRGMKCAWMEVTWHHVACVNFISTRLSLHSSFVFNLTNPTHGHNASNYSPNLHGSLSDLLKTVLLVRSGIASEDGPSVLHPSCFRFPTSCSRSAQSSPCITKPHSCGVRGCDPRWDEV